MWNVHRKEQSPCKCQQLQKERTKGAHTNVTAITHNKQKLHGSTTAVTGELME